jgi:GPH family glycoside/pentoside/hexuronide:cation symporter
MARACDTLCEEGPIFFIGCSDKVYDALGKINLTTLCSKLSLKEKVGYGMGDGAFNFIWMPFVYFQLFFYTDVFGISAAAVGIMLLVARIWDTVNDPLMGLIADRTSSRWGKYRPYLLFGAIPLGILATLSFTTPNFSANGKLIYAYVTYFMLGMAYTSVNIPYSSLMSTMTNDLGERAALSIARFIGAFSIGAIVLYCTMDLVDLLGGSDKARGFQYTMALFSVVVVVMLFFTFSLTKERIKPVNPGHSNFSLELRNLIITGPFIALFFVGIFALSLQSIRNGITIHYFKYLIGDEGLASYFMFGGIMFSLLGIALTKLLTDRWDKKKVYFYSMLSSSIPMVMIYFLGPEHIELIFILNFASALLAGPTVPIIWAMYTDIVDYSELQSGTRTGGLVFAGASFSQKLGWTIGGAMAGFLLAFFHYQPNVAQSAQSLQGINLMFTLIPFALALLAAFSVFFYKLDNRTMQTVLAKLDNQRLLTK